MPVLAGRLQFRPDLKGAKIYRDALTGDLQKIEGNLGVELSLASDDLSVFIEAALLFVERNAPEFSNLLPSQLIFDETSLLFNPREQFLTFRTKREGILVEDASLKFRFLGGRLVQLVANTYPSLNLEYEDPDVDSKAVLESLGFERVNKRDKVLRVAKEGPKEVLRPVDRLTAFKDGQYFEVQVSLRDGRIFEVAPTTFHLAGKVEADIYSRWYGEESLKLPLADLTLAQNLATNKEGMFEVEPKTEVKLKGLNGKNVNISLVSGDQISVVGVTQQNFMSVLVPKLVGDAHADKQAAQAMVYFHTDLKIKQLDNLLITTGFAKH